MGVIRFSKLSWGVSLKFTYRPASSKTPVLYADVPVLDMVPDPVGHPSMMSEDPAQLL